jgi:hypothetical protein
VALNEQLTPNIRHRYLKGVLVGQDIFTYNVNPINVADLRRERLIQVGKLGRKLNEEDLGFTTVKNCHQRVSLDNHRRNNKSIFQTKNPVI